MYTINKSKYVNSLIDYILDVKPYHDKLTEIILEYQFYDTVNVKMMDSSKTNTILSSVWDTGYYTDGARSRFLTPSYNLPRYSIQSNRHHFNKYQSFIFNNAVSSYLLLEVSKVDQVYHNGQLVSSDNYTFENSYISFSGLIIFEGDKFEVYEFTPVDYLLQKYNIDNAYQLRASRGIESVILNSTNQLVEGIDFFLSKGMYSFEVKNDYYVRINNFETLSNGTTIIGNYITDNCGQLVKDKRVDKSWNKLDDPFHQKDGRLITYLDYNNKINFEVFDVNTKKLFNTVKLYPDDHTIDSWTVEHVFDCNLLRFDVFNNLPNQLISRKVNHNLHSSDFVFQIYEKRNESNFNAILTTLEIIDNNNVSITLDNDIDSIKVSLFKTEASNKFEILQLQNNWNIQHNFNSTSLQIQVYTEINGAFQYTIPFNLSIVDEDNVIISFVSPVSGYVLIVPCEGVISNIEDCEISNIWKIPNVRNKLPIFSCYEQDGSSYRMVIPGRVENIGSVLEIEFTNPIRGFVSYLEVQIESFITNTSTSWTLQHGLNNKNLLWQVYKTFENEVNAVLTDAIAISNDELRVDVSNLNSQGSVSLFDVPSQYRFDIVDPSFTWNIFHNLGTKNVVVQVFIDNNGIIESAYPEEVSIQNFTNIQVKFIDNNNSPKKGYVLIVPHCEQIISKNEYELSIPIVDNLYPIFNCFLYNNGIYELTLPNYVKINNGNLLIGFSYSFTGQITYFNKVESWYKVTSKLNGLLGFAQSNKHFYGRGIEFFINGITSQVGAKAYITLSSDNFVIHPNAQEETWTLIKTNLQAYDNLICTYVGLPQADVISAIWPEDEVINGNLVTAVEKITDSIAFPEYEYLKALWTITCVVVTNDTATFQITNSFESNYNQLQSTSISSSLCTFDITSLTNELRFRVYIKLGSRNLKVGDNYTFGFGYDKDDYDFIGGYENAEYTELSRRGTSFEFHRTIAPIKAIPLGSAFSKAINETWAFIFRENGQFFEVFGTASGGKQIAFLGKEYDNDLIRLRLIRSTEKFDVINSYNQQYLENYVSGAMFNEELKDGDTFYFSIKKNKPSYLVHGSISGYEKPAQIGHYYWNGKIGFFLSRPYYNVSYNKTEIKQLDLGTTPIFNGVSLTFNNAPRVDAEDEQIVFTYHTEANNIQKFEIKDPLNKYLICDFDVDTVEVWRKNSNGYSKLSKSIDYIADFTGIIYLDSLNVSFGDIFVVKNAKLVKIGEPRKQFLVYSSLRGQLPAMIVGERYQEFECAENTSERSWIIDLTLTEHTDFTNDFDFSFTVNIRSHVHKMYHDQEVLIIPKHENNLGTLTVNTFQEDILTVNLNAIHPELGSYTNLVPTFLLSADEYNNFSLGYDGHLVNLFDHPVQYTITNDYIIEQDVSYHGTTYPAARFDFEKYDEVGFDTDGTYGDYGQVDGRDFDSHYFDHPRKQNPSLPDRGYTYEVWLKNVKDVKVGTLTWQYDEYGKVYRQVIDTAKDFTDQYLKLNTELNLNVKQADEYNDLIKVLFSEKLEFTSGEKFNNDLINTLIIDSTFLRVDNRLDKDDFNARVSDFIKEMSNGETTVSSAVTSTDDRSFQYTITLDQSITEGFEMTPYDIIGHNNNGGYEQSPDGTIEYEKFYVNNLIKSFSHNVFMVTCELLDMPNASIQIKDINGNILKGGKNYISDFDYSTIEYTTGSLLTYGPWYTMQKTTGHKTMAFTILNPQPISVEIIP